MPARITRDYRASLKPRYRQRAGGVVRGAAMDAYQVADTMVAVDSGALKLTGKVIAQGDGWAVVYGGQSAAPVKVRSHDRGDQRIRGYVRSHPADQVAVDYAIHVELGEHARPFLLPALAIVASRLREQGYRIRVVYGAAR